MATETQSRYTTMMRYRDDEDDDVEALRMAALRTLKKKSEPPRPQRTVFQQHNDNRNLIAIVPVVDDPPVHNEVFQPVDTIVKEKSPVVSPLKEMNDSTGPKVILPQDRYCKLDQEVTSSPEREKVPAKFRRFDESDSSSESESESSDESEEERKSPEKNEKASSPVEEENKSESDEDLVLGLDDDDSFDMLVDGLNQDSPEKPAQKSTEKPVKERSEKNIHEYPEAPLQRRSDSKTHQKRSEARSRHRSRSPLRRRQPLSRTGTPSLSPSPERSSSRQKRYRSPLHVHSSSPSFNYWPKSRSPSQERRKSKRSDKSSKKSKRRSPRRSPSRKAKKEHKSNGEHKSPEMVAPASPNSEKLEARRRKFETQSVVTSSRKKISLKGADSSPNVRDGSLEPVTNETANEDVQSESRLKGAAVAVTKRVVTVPSDQVSEKAVPKSSRSEKKKQQKMTAVDIVNKNERLEEEKEKDVVMEESDDLRTELKRRRAERKAVMKGGSGDVLPTRLMQSALRDVVGKTVLKKMNNDMGDGKYWNKTDKEHSDSRRVLILPLPEQRVNQPSSLSITVSEDQDSSSPSKVPVHLRLGLPPKSKLSVASAIVAANVDRAEVRSPGKKSRKIKLKRNNSLRSKE